MKVKALYRIGFLVVNMLLSGCTYTVYLPDDEDINAKKNGKVAVAKPEFGNQCRYSGNGEYGACPTSNSEMVGTSCSCPTPSGQIMGTVSKQKTCFCSKQGLSIIRRWSVGLFTSFKKSRLEKKFKKNEWVIIQPIPFAQFEQLIVDHVDGGWEIEDDYERLAETTAKWQCELRKGTSILTCVWTAKQQGIVYGPERVLTGLSEKLNIPTSTAIATTWF